MGYILTKDRAISLKGFKSTDSIDEPLKDEVIIVDIDTFGFSDLERIIHKNVCFALTKRKSPGFFMFLISLGFKDVLFKPIEEEKLKEVIGDLSEESEGRIIPLSNLHFLKGELYEELCAILGDPENTKKILRYAGLASKTEAPVLLTGESGTGKELFAKAIWRLSKRWDRPFIPVNCSAIPESLFEAELFGYEKGAFTGALKEKRGILELAHRGTLFLDEIGEMPLSLQPKLLRFLEDGEIRRVGGEKEIKLDVRIICATNRDIKKLVQEGKFREDLYHRISTFHIHLPPLRERRQDIPILVECFINRFSKELGKKIEGYSEAFLKRLMNYPFFGNVRELEAIIRRVVALQDGRILYEKTLSEVMHGEIKKDHQWKEPFKNHIRALLYSGEREIFQKIKREIEELLFEEALSYTKGNKLRASTLLGINRLTLKKKICR